MAERRIALSDEAATVRLAEDLAMILEPGDVLCLEGDLGAGKSTLARAILRTLADDPELEVPSPTFTLVQAYDFPALPVAHFDLYRLAGEDELDEIGFDAAIRDGAALIEWPSRAGAALPADRVTIALDAGPSDDARLARISGPPGWMTRFERSRQIRAFLDDAGAAGAARRVLKADASHRRLERIRLGGVSRVLMSHPPETDDAAGHARKAARAAAKLAEDARAFVAIGKALETQGFSAPHIEAHDVDAGFVLMEDFGDAFIAAGGQPIEERYLAAVDVLAELHARDLPPVLPLAGAQAYTLPEYNHADMIVQLEPFLDWAMPHLFDRVPTPEERDAFNAAWRPCLETVLAGGKTWALRDYHSPNLMWLADREGHRRVGLLDFQDAVRLHPAYDLASLAQDARVTVPADLEARLVAHYVSSKGETLDAGAFRRAYAILAAQRATRILGIFARLTVRDHRPDYLHHVPRIKAYLSRSLAQPVLADVRAWFERHVPVAIVTVT